MRGNVLNTGDTLRSIKDGVTWYDTGAKVANRSSVDLVGFTVTDDPDTRILTITAPSGSMRARKNSAGSTFSRNRFNFIEGDNITLDVADDSGDDEIDITITAPDSINTEWPTSNRRLTMLSTSAHDPTPTIATLFSSTPVSAGTTAFTSDTTGSYIRSTSAAAAGATAGYACSTLWDSVDADTLPDITFVWRQINTVLTNYRIWVGVTSTGPMTSDSPTANIAAFRASSTAVDTNFQAYSNDNSGGGTTTDTGVTIPNSVTRFIFRIEFVSVNELNFYIDGSLVATHTGNIPIGGNRMGFICRAATLSAAAAKGIDFSHCYALET